MAEDRHHPTTGDAVAGGLGATGPIGRPPRRRWRLQAVVLSRCLAAAGDVPSALATYQHTRRDRVAAIQKQSDDNAFRPATPIDVPPVHGFDAWAVPLAPTSAPVAGAAVGRGRSRSAVWS